MAEGAQELVRFERNGDVGVITLNRPDALNALSLQLTQDLDRAIHLAIAYLLLPFRTVEVRLPFFGTKALRHLWDGGTQISTDTVVALRRSGFLI